MLINGREYTDKQICDMEKLYRRKKQKGEITVSPVWGAGHYVVHYSDGSKNSVLLSEGDKFPDKKNCSITMITKSHA